MQLKLIISRETFPYYRYNTYNFYKETLLSFTRFSTMFSAYPRAMSFLKEMIYRHQHRIYLTIWWTIISSLFALIGPYIAKIEIDQLVDQSPSFWAFTSSPLGIFLIIIWVAFLINLIEKVLASMTDYFKNIYENDLEDDHFMRLYRRLKHVELGVYANKKNQDLFSSILQETRLVQNLVSQWWEYLHIWIFVLWSIGLLSQIDRKIWVALAIWWWSYYFFYRKQTAQEIRKKCNTRELERAKKNVMRMAETSYQKLVFMWGNTMVIETIDEYNRENRDIIKQYQKKTETFRWINYSIDKLIEYSIKIIIWVSIFAATSSVGTMAMTLALLSTLSWMISNLVRSKKKFEETKEKVAILELYLEATEELWVHIPPRDDVFKISLKNVAFSYPQFTTYEMKYFEILLERLSSNSNKTEYELNQLHTLQELKKTSSETSPVILSNISLTLEKWNVYGIVGKNGAWKTTLMHLIMWYFRTYQGNILRDDHEQKTLWIDHSEKHIAVIEQEPFLMWGFTIRQNLIVWSSKLHSDAELYDLLKIFWLDTYIASLRKWLDTVYAFDTDFSGGQKQIISLLRVYLQDKSVLILDEWTNQLDAENEEKVMNLFLWQKKEKIIIMISHRMTTLQKADHLYCLERWEITDQWTPSELRKKDSLYARLWKKQIGED